jgi:putative transposase/transposase-like zinc-binding protein
VADIFRCRGPAWRASHAGHVSLGQLKVMSAIERCRTAALGGHVERCVACAHLHISYNSCRNRHCPKCQAAAAQEWLADRQAELLPVPYFHVVFTLPGALADIAYQNRAVVYDLLLKTAAETLITIAADPKHLGARIGLTAVLHTWGSALTHHPHAHIIVPGGGLSPEPAPAQAGGQHWIACRPGFFLSVRVLSRLFRRLFLERLTAAYQANRLEFFADQAALAEPAAFKAYLAPLRQAEWVVYAKRPFGGPDAVLAYLSRYTHRIAIANSRLVAFDGERVTFKWKDYRAKLDARYKLMTLRADEFIRRFLIHVLPDGFHRIRHYGLFANGGRAQNIARARQLLNVPVPQNARSDADSSDTDSTGNDEPRAFSHPCPCCGGRMIIIEIFERGCAPRYRATVPDRVDSS